MTVEQNVAYGMKNRGFEKKLIPNRTNEMLELVKLTGFEKRLSLIHISEPTRPY